MTTPQTSVPVSPFGVKLTGRSALARYWFGSDSAENRRRITGLVHEVRPENRLPHGMEGDGRTPFSYTGWLDEFALSRRQAAAAAPSPK